MAGGARVVIGADVKEVQPAIDSVVRSVQQGATQVGGAFQGWVGNSNAVASATEKLERQLKGFASEQRTQGRMARFYAGEIASIIPAASGARSAIEGLAGVAIEGIAGGLSLGLAFESVKLVIGAVTAAMAEAAQRMKDMEAASLTAAAGISAAADALERMKRPAESMAQKAFREVFDAGTKGAKDLTDQIEKLRPSTMQLVWAFMWDGSVGMKRLNDEFATAARNLDTMTAAARKYATEAAALFPDAEVAGPGNDIGAGKFAVNNEKATKARERAAAAAAEEARAQKKIADELERSLNAWMQMAGPGNMAGEEQFKIDSAAKKAEDQWLPVFGPGNDQGAQQFGDQVQRINTESAQMQEIWSSIGGSVSNAFSSVGAAVGGIAGKVLSWLGQMITQAIQLAVAMSAAGSAWTTPLGSLAIGAAVAAGLISLIASVSARASGGPVSGMQPYLVGERGPELFVPGTSGSIVPNHAMGGTTVHVNFSIAAFDGESVYRTLTGSRDQLARVVREAVRDGVMG